MAAMAAMPADPAEAGDHGRLPYPDDPDPRRFSQ
jgi:hypothetical protein